MAALIGLLAAAPERADAIIGGQPVSPDLDLSRVVLSIVFETGRCSAVLVGPGVVLTLGRCVGSSGVGRISVEGQTLRGRCERMPPEAGQEPVKEADYALCHFDALNASAASKLFPRRPTLGEKLVVAGYGCTLPGGLDQQSRHLSAGTAQVVEANRDGYVVTEGAASCFGDSGGPVFSQDEEGRLLVVGILSRGDIERTSYILPIADERFLKWLEEWGEANSATPCITEVVVNRSNCDEPGREFELTLTFPDELPTSAIDETPLLPQRIIRVNATQGETVRSLVERNCGKQDENYYRLLDNWHSRETLELVTPAVSADYEFSENKSFDIPDCAAFATGLRIQPMRVETQKGLWEFWEKVKKIGNEEGLHLGWRDFAVSTDAIDPLRPFEGSSSIDSQVFVEVIRALNPDLKRLEPNTIVRVPISPQRTKPRLTYAADAQPVFSMSEAICAPPIGGYPYDLEATLDILSLNNRPLVRGWRPKRPVNILVADSGLSGADGQSGSVFGVGAIADASVAALGDLEPVQSEAENSKVRNHGTQVASLALGGPVFARFNAQQVSPLIQLTPVRLYTLVTKVGADDSITRFVGLPREKLEDVLRKLGSTEIVNLSLKNEEEIESLRDHLKEDVYLFVVAAGNGDGQIDNDGAKDVFPAQWGGRGNLGEQNLIVVTAIQANGEFVEGTNYGPGHVDIGAPGCDVLALVYDEDLGAFRNQSVSGTSFAAPLVSFAAALVRGEYGRDISPHEIKRRLLVSSDLDPELTDKIQDGRVLNIVKAISIYHDVVQDTEGSIFWGQLRWYVDNVLYQPGQDRNVLFDCDGDARGIRPENILKLGFGFQRADGSRGVMVYSLNASSEMFDADICGIPDSAALSLQLVDANTGGVRTPSLNDLQDVIPKMR